MDPPTFNTPDRPLTWLITGCSSGMGLALGHEVQAHGGVLIATSRNPSRTPDLVTEVQSKGGKWIALDVDDPDCGSVITKLEQEGHAIDILVNNAGYSIHQAVEHFTDDELRRMMETLYFGPCRLMRAAVPGMRKRRFGVIVNISSGAGLEGRESMGGYAAAKAALDGITKVMAKEVAAFNVRALYITLGGFNTNMPTAAVAGEQQMDEDYEGSTVHALTNVMAGGKFVPLGDKDKAARVIHDVVIGSGVGAGHEAEVQLVLGTDAVQRAEEVRDKLQHTLDIFGDLARSVGRDS